MAKTSPFVPAPEAPVSPCPRCRRTELREDLLQTVGVLYHRCGACGHVWVVRLSREAPDSGDPPV